MQKFCLYCGEPTNLNASILNQKNIPSCSTCITGGMIDLPVTRWKVWNFLNKAAPKAPAVYCVFIRGVLSYIGSTMNLYARIRQHKIKYNSFTNILTTPWGEIYDGDFKLKFSTSKKFGDWLMREARLIERFKPVFNTAKFVNAVYDKDRY